MKQKSKSPTRKWSKQVTENSRALHLEEGIFTVDDPMEIAKSLKKSALESRTRKGTPYQSAMSMLNFYINRAGSNLSSKQKAILERAKQALKVAFNKSNGN